MSEFGGLQKCQNNPACTLKRQSLYSFPVAFSLKSMIHFFNPSGNKIQTHNYFSKERLFIMAHDNVIINKRSFESLNRSFESFMCLDLFLEH